MHIQASSPGVVVLGVTGHRDLHEADEIDFAFAVENILNRYVRDLPNSSIVFVTALAEGADQIAAQVAVSIANVTVIAALPMPLNEYREDFSGPSLAAFDDLLGRCDDRVELLPPDLVRSDLSRDAFYQFSGRWLARTCNVLIAAWDGEPPEFVGGTADNIYYKTEGLSPLPSMVFGNSDGKPDQGVILVCLVSRKRNSDVARGQASSVKVLQPMGVLRSWDEQVDNVSAEIEVFNAESISANDSASQSSSLFHAADALATRLQGRYRRLLIVIIVLGLLSVASIDLFMSVRSPAYVVLAGATFVLTLIAWVWLMRSRLRERFQQSRALAEGARVQEVWRSVDMQLSVADSFLRGQGRDVAWIRSSLRGAQLIDSIVGTKQVDISNVRNWMLDQVEYFDGTAATSGAISRAWGKHLRQRRRAIVLLFVAGLALGSEALAILTNLEFAFGFGDYLSLVWTLSVGGAVALISYGELMGFGQLARRYEISASYFRQGVLDLQRAELLESTQACADVARDVGLEALREASDWLAMQSERKVRPV